MNYLRLKINILINWSQNVAIICCVATVLKIKIKEIIGTLENLKPIGGGGTIKTQN